MKKNVGEIICKNFPISNSEYLILEKEFGKLIKFEAWALIKKNTKNNYTDEFDDINQELIMSIIRAGSYYKRQVFIEESFQAAKQHLKDSFLLSLLLELEELWHNRTRHGANRQKFGEFQEKILDKLLHFVPTNDLPNKAQNLRMDQKFAVYCKAISWNTQKSMGRKITKEKAIRTGLCSLSDHEFLAEC